MVKRLNLVIFTYMTNAKLGAVLSQKDSEIQISIRT